MTASMEFVSILVTGATVLASLAPMVLLALWVRDALRRQLW